MSTNQTDPIVPVVEVGDDFTEAVTVAEVGIVARQIGVDPLGEIEQGGPKRWEAMARLGWVLDRRRDPKVQPDRWLGLRIPELLTALGIPEGDTDDQAHARAVAREAADAANPTDSGRE
jgi:hypothetical protein